MNDEIVCLWINLLKGIFLIFIDKEGKKEQEECLQIKTKIERNGKKKNNENETNVDV